MVEMHSNRSSVQLGPSRYANAIDLAYQYWDQRPANGYVEGGREPRFNATASGRPAELTSIHQSPASVDDHSTFSSGLEGSGPMLIYGNQRIVDDGSDFLVQMESDPAHPDA